jgi:hypothetical protein
LSRKYGGKIIARKARVASFNFRQGCRGYGNRSALGFGGQSLHTISLRDTSVTQWICRLRICDSTRHWGRMPVITRFWRALSAYKIWRNRKNAKAQCAMRKFHTFTIAQGTLVCEATIARISPCSKRFENRLASNLRIAIERFLK